MVFSQIILQAFHSKFFSEAWLQLEKEHHNEKTAETSHRRFLI